MTLVYNIKSRTTSLSAILGEEVAGANVGYLHYGKEHSWIPF